MGITIQEKEPGLFMLDGELTFANINKKTINLLPLPKNTQKITLDLRRVATTDSAGLALIIEWMKLAESNKKHLELENTPEQLLSIARLSGLELMIRLTS